MKVNFDKRYLVGSGEYDKNERSVWKCDVVASFSGRKEAIKAARKLKDGFAFDTTINRLVELTAAPKNATAENEQTVDAV